MCDLLPEGVIARYKVTLQVDSYGATRHEIQDNIEWKLSDLSVNAHVEQIYISHPEI